MCDMGACTWKAQDPKVKDLVLDIAKAFHKATDDACLCMD